MVRDSQVPFSDCELFRTVDEVGDAIGGVIVDPIAKQNPQ